MDRDDRKRKQPDSGFNEDPTLDRTAAFDWRAGLPPSLRLENRAQIAQTIQNSANLDDPMALSAAHSLEVYCYQIAASEYDYLTRIGRYLQGEPDAAHRADLGIMLPQQNVPSDQGIVGPSENPPALSRKRKGKQPIAEGSMNSPMNVFCRPTENIEYLVERHNRIAMCLQNLALQFLKKLEMEGTQQGVSAGESTLRTNNPMTRMPTILQQTINLHRRIAGEFSYGLVELAKLLEKMASMVEYRENVLLLEQMYEEKILQLLGTFIVRVQMRLDECSSDYLHRYRQWALSIQYQNVRYRSEHLVGQSPLKVFREIGPSSAIMQSLYLYGYLLPEVRQMRVELFSPNAIFVPAQRTSQRGFSQPQNSGTVAAVYPNQETVAPVQQWPQAGILPGNSGAILPPEQQLHQQQPGVSNQEILQPVRQSLEQPQQQPQIFPGNRGAILPPEQQPHEQQQGSNVAEIPDEFWDSLDRIDQ